MSVNNALLERNGAVVIGYADTRRPNAALSRAYVGAAMRKVMGPPMMRKAKAATKGSPVSRQARRYNPPSTKQHAPIVTTKAAQLTRLVVIAL